MDVKFLLRGDHGLLACKIKYRSSSFTAGCSFLVMKSHSRVDELYDSTGETTPKQSITDIKVKSGKMICSVENTSISTSFECSENAENINSLGISLNVDGSKDININEWIEVTPDADLGKAIDINSGLEVSSTGIKNNLSIAGTKGRNLREEVELLKEIEGSIVGYGRSV